MTRARTTGGRSSCGTGSPTQPCGVRSIEKDPLLHLTLATNTTSPTKAAEYLRAAIELADQAADLQRAALLRTILGSITYR